MTLKTIVYFLACLCITLAGLALLFAFRQYITMISISTSIVAGGISSIAFGINRYLDEKSSEQEGSELKRLLAVQAENIDLLDHALNDIRSLAILAEGPAKRRIYDHHPKEEIQEELRHIRKDRFLTVDALGLSLKQFFDDFLDTFHDREHGRIRILVQHPGVDTFGLICKQEGREERMVRTEVLGVTEKILQLQKPGINSNRRSDDSEFHQIEIKWLSVVPSVTLTRFNQVMFVRARYLREAMHPPMVFERYSELEGKSFVAFTSYFQTAWDSGVTPTDADCERLRGLSEANGR